jgi:SAM-dependent methyltransferase
MPSLTHNIMVWDATYEWPEHGDEWSAAWGGAANQWSMWLYPRIQAFLPARRVLEIAVGHGRWTQFLGRHCDELLGVDLAVSAVAHCRERFSGDPRMTFAANDGTSLAIAGDRSVDLVFSFDSLVHAEADVLGGYLTEIARVLTDDGVAFLHHSNVAALGAVDVERIHWRAPSVSGEVVERFAARAGLKAVIQEPLAWEEGILTDCVSVIARPGSRWDQGPNRVVPNMSYRTHETPRGAAVASLYPAAAPLTGRGAGHAEALARAERGDVDGGYEALRRAVGRGVDAEALNDLAVLAHHRGDLAEARALLEALVLLHPGHTAAHENLADLRALAGG